MAWISNYNHCFLWDVITHPWPNFGKGLAKLLGMDGISNHILLFYVDLITYTCLNALLVKESLCGVVKGLNM